MYLNVNVAANASSSEASCSATPRTPEILNLLAGGPFESAGPKLNFPGSRAHFNPQATVASTPGDAPCSPREHAAFSPGSSLSSPATPGTPGSSSTGHLPSIQNTRTYLIKEGLKLTIQSKRLASGQTPTLDTEPPVHQQRPKEELTPEDEERRRRRRERNKLAATKCRNRKKERTGILLHESDTLEDQNVSMRTEIQKLEAEKRRLMEVLATHSTSCVKTGGASAGASTSYASDTPGASHTAAFNAMRGMASPPCASYVTDFSGVASQQQIYDCRAPSASTMTSQTHYDVSQCLSYSSDSYAMAPGHHLTYDGSSQSYR